jgi:uncharacterized protein (TIGR03066 family)
MRERIMRGTRWASLAAVVIILTFSASLLHAEDKPKDLIVGKWEPGKVEKDVKAVIEFTKDGKVKIIANAGGQEFKLDGTYKFTDDKNMEVTVEFMGKKDTKKVKVIKVTKDELVTQDEGKDEEEKFKKVK